MRLLGNRVIFAPSKTQERHDDCPLNENHDDESWPHCQHEKIALMPRDLSLRRQSERSDRKSTRLNSSHDQISYAVFCLKKKTPPGRTRSRTCSARRLRTR